ncbi:MAG: N-acetylmuramoyl-L-alanine amidase family protein [Acidimicrobiia bacterium]
MRKRARWACLLVVIGVIAATPAIADTERASGLITPSGVPVAVLAPAGTGRNWVMTPCGNETLVFGGVPIRDVDVILDPGHGGPVDSGAVASSGLTEKEVNLKVAQTAATMLQARGVATVLTRTGDYATPLRVRANLADTLGAKLLISIHHNAPLQASSPVPGVEIFHENGSPDSRRLGGLVYERLMTALSTFVVDWVAPNDAGVMVVLNTSGRDAYGMIRLPETTSVLAELGYMANPAEAELFARPVYPLVAGRAIADAVLDYLETDKPGAGYVAPRVFNPLPGVGRARCVETPLRAPPLFGPR